MVETQLSVYAVKRAVRSKVRAPEMNADEYSLEKRTRKTIDLKPTENSAFVVLLTPLGETEAVL